MLFDTHVHLQAYQFKDDLEEVINRAIENGVTRMLVVGFDRATIKQAIELAEKYDFIYAAVGWHPVDAIDIKEDDFNQIEKLMQHDKVVALGEIGLDYHWDKSPKDIQKEVFIRQIKIAIKYNKPIIIHNRDATKDVYDILKDENASEIGGIMHCFSGSKEMALEFIKLGFYISLGGPVTFKNGKKAKEVASVVPVDRLLIETDCPYLAPHPHRGKRNEPMYVKLICETIADIKELNYEEIAKITTNNANKLFKLED